MKLHKRIDLLGKAIALMTEIPGGKDGKGSEGHVFYQQQMKRALGHGNLIYWHLCDDEFEDAQRCFDELAEMVAKIKKDNNIYF